MTNKTPKFFFIIPVWGDEYIEMLTNVTLRTLISPLNFPSIDLSSGSKLILTTPSSDFAKIEKNPIFQLTQNFISIEHINLPNPKGLTIHGRMSLGYQLATQQAINEGAFCVYLTPDAILSDGSIITLKKYAVLGKKVVLVPGPRVKKEEFISHLNLSDNTGIKPRDLARLGLNLFHEDFNRYNIKHKTFTQHPHLVTWSSPNEDGLLIRSFHLHPIMISTENGISKISFTKNDTIDGKFIQNNFSDLNQFQLIRDSDEMVFYTLTKESDRTVFTPPEQKNRIRTIIDMSNHEVVNELHKIYFYYPYFLHTDSLDKNWLDLEQKTLKFCNQILKGRYIRITLSFSSLSLKHLKSKIKLIFSRHTLKRIISKFKTLIYKRVVRHIKNYLS